MKKGLECCGAGFRVSDIYFRQEERTELKHVTFENMPICTDIRWQNSSAGGMRGRGGFGDVGALTR